jgi:hypothetical protein
MKALTFIDIIEGGARDLREDTLKFMRVKKVSKETENK